MSAIDEVCTALDRRTLRWSLAIDAEADRIWQALTREEELVRWFMPCKVDLRLGGKVVFNAPDPWVGDISVLDALANSQPGGPGTHWPGVAAGWHAFLEALDAHLGKRPLPGEEHYQSLIGDNSEWLKGLYVA